MNKKHKETSASQNIQPNSRLLIWLTRFLFTLFILLLALGQLERIQVSRTSAIYGFDLLIAGWVGVMLFFDGAFRQKIMAFCRRRPLEQKVLLGWIIVGLVVAWWQHFPVVTAISYLARLALYLSFGLLQLHLIQKDVLKKSELTLGYFLFGVLLLYFGLLQYAFLPDTRFLFFLGWDYHYYRLISTIFDPGFTGVLLVMSFFFWQAISSRFAQHNSSQNFSVNIPRYLFWGISIAYVIGIALTYSRASYLAFGVGIIVSWAANFWQKTNSQKVQKRKFWWPILLYGILLVSFLPFLPQPGGEGVNLARTSTVSARVNATESIFGEIHGANWLIGQGLFVNPKNSVTIYNQPDHARVPDNWLVFLLMGSGVVGLVIALVALVNYLKKYWPNNSWLLAIWLGLLVHSFFEASLVYPFVVLVLIGMTVSLG